MARETDGIDELDQTMVEIEATMDDVEHEWGQVREEWDRLRSTLRRGIIGFVVAITLIMTAVMVLLPSLL